VQSVGFHVEFVDISLRSGSRCPFNPASQNEVCSLCAWALHFMHAVELAT
jgi:hypothetical protein